MAKRKIKLDSIISEYLRTYKHLLVEDRESKNLDKARRVIRQINPNVNAAMITNAIRTNIPNSRLNSCEFLPGLARMYMKKELADYDTISKVDDILAIINNKHFNEYNQDLNGMAAKELVDTFKSEVEADFQKDVSDHNNVNFTTNNNYTITRIECTQDAWPFEPYTDWCIASTAESDNGYYDEDEDEDYYEEEFDPYQHPELTTGYEMYESYTCDGLGLFYIITKKGFENVPRKKGDNFPLDEYGLSMIATSVDEHGKCKTITSRWNHEKGATDHVMTPMQLSELIGMNYYQVFKPYTAKERQQRGKITFDEARELLDKGTPWYQIFPKDHVQKTGDVITVNLNSKKNFVDPNTNQLISKIWFKDVGEFSKNGIATVKIESNQYNYLTKNGTLLLPQNARYVDGFHNSSNFAYYEISDMPSKYNIINTQGKVINKKALSERIIEVEEDGNFYKIRLQNEGYKILYHTGDELLENEQIESVTASPNGYLWVRMGDGSDYSIDSNSDECVIKPDGSLFLGRYFNYIYNTKYGVVVQNDNGKQGYFTFDGELICNTWFDNIGDSWPNGIPKVTQGNYVNYLNIPEKKLLLKRWAENGTRCYSNMVAVKLGIKWYIMNTNGTMVVNDSYDSFEILKTTYGPHILPAIVSKDGKYNVVYENGKMLDKWFDRIKNTKYETIGELGGREYQINSQTNTFKDYTGPTY